MAAETFELFSITNKLVMDTGQFDRAVSASRPKAQALHGDLKKLETQASQTGSSLNRDLGGALDALSPRLGSLTTGGVAGLAIAGVGALTAVVTGAAVGVWNLTNRFSEIGSELADMRDQVNFTTDSLGTMSGVGKSVGVEVTELSAALVVFQKNLAKGDEIFKLLGVTSKDNEKALRETYKALASIEDKTLQTAAAAEIFGKSGKAMLAVIKATGGDFDAARAKLRKWNVLLSAEAVEIADEFGDMLGVLVLRAQGIGNIFATQTAPAFTAGFIAIEAALDSNEVQWKEWGEFVAKAILSAEVLIGGLANVVKNYDWTNLIPFYGTGKAIGDFTTGANKTADIVVPEYFKRTQEPTVGAGFELPDSLKPKSEMEKLLEKYFKEKGGGGKKKGKTDAQREAEREKKEAERLTDQRTDYVEDLNLAYRKLQEQLKGVDTTTRSYAVAESQLTGVLKGASPELIKQAEAMAKNADNAATQLRLQNELAAFIKTQDAAVKLAIDGEKSHTQASEDFITSLERQGAVLQETTKAWLRFAAVMRDTFADIQKLPENIDKATQAFPLPEIIFPTQSEDDIARGAGDAANREAGPAPPVPTLDPMIKWREALEDFSYDATHTIADSIEAGFRDGIDAGIKEFVRGLLEMAKQEALAALQRAIFNALNPKSEEGEGGEGGGGRGGGSGFLSTAIHFGLSALGALFGGGGGSSGGLGSAAAGGIGGAAEGGYQPAGKWYWRGEHGPELVKAGAGGDSIMSNSDSLAFAGMMGGGGGQTINIYANDVRAAFSRETLTQAKSKLRKLQRGR